MDKEASVLGKYSADFNELFSQKPVSNVPEYDYIFSLPQKEQKILFIGSNISLICGNELPGSGSSHFTLIIGLYQKGSLTGWLYIGRFAQSIQGKPFRPAIPLGGWRMNNGQIISLVIGNIYRVIPHKSNTGVVKRVFLQKLLV